MYTLDGLRKRVSKLNQYINEVAQMLLDEGTIKSKLEARNAAEKLVFGALLADLMLIQDQPPIPFRDEEE